ncbi:MAG: MBL fold metallo-hydrolase [Sphaerochaetaceae bacterium]
MKHFVWLLSFVLCLGTLFATDQKVDRFSSLCDRSEEKGKVTMYFVDLDVPKGSKDKSGDSTIIISPDGKVMLLDCGHPDAAKDVIKVLQTLDIKKIDIFVNSHPHIDHLGAFPQIAELFDIGEVYRSTVEYKSSVYYRDFVSAIESHKIPVRYIKDGDSFMLGSSVRVDVLGPKAEIVYPSGYPDNSTQFLNDESVVLQLTYGDSKMLFSGDLYRGGEREVLDSHKDILASDVAKANHHGNDTSNQLGWIKAVRPQVVVAMNDTMGSMTVLHNYVKYGATFYHTLYNGLIKVQVDEHHKVNVQTQYDSWVEKTER